MTIENQMWSKYEYTRTSFWSLERENVAGRSSVSRIDYANANEIDSVRDKLVDERLWSVANHLTRPNFSFLFCPSLNLVAFEVSWIWESMTQTNAFRQVRALQN